MAMYFSISDSADEPVPKKARLVAGGTIEESDTTFRVNFKCPACFRKRLDIKVNLHTVIKILCIRTDN